MSRLRERKGAPRAKFPPTLLVCFACNDGDNGLWRGTVEGLSFHGRCTDEYIQMDFSFQGAPRLTIGDGWLRIFRRKLPFSASVEWYGNWCWNGYRMFVGEAAVVLCEAVRSGKFSFDAASGFGCDVSELLEADAKAPVTAVIDALSKMARAV